jgi:histidine triad (HIT) family protein
MTDSCVFCRIITGIEPVTLVAHWPNVWAIVPLNPVVDGHVLFIPTLHVEDFSTVPAISSSVMFRAAQYAQKHGGDCNLITSKGKDATATVGHFHLHYVPRVAGDRLALPWTGQVAA